MKPDRANKSKEAQEPNRFLCQTVLPKSRLPLCTDAKEKAETELEETEKVALIARQRGHTG